MNHPTQPRRPKSPFEQTARRIPAQAIIVIGLLGLLTLGCTSGYDEVDYQPNIVLITVDTLRADWASPYFSVKDKTIGWLAQISYNRDSDAWPAKILRQRVKRPTPNIESIASAGIVFTNAHCDVTWTTPSMASTLTGTYAFKHGLRSNRDRLAESQLTVTELLKDEGYTTAAVIGSYPLDSIYGLDQGFDVYDDDFTTPLFDRAATTDSLDNAKEKPMAHERAQPEAKPTGTFGRRSDREVTSTATRVLASIANKEAPFFLWVHYFGPHSLLYTDLDLAENDRRHVESYAEKVATTDREIGGLLSALDQAGLTDGTLLILHADHGESLWEHGYVGHGRYLYEDNLRIPLVMRWPDAIKGPKRTRALVGNIDIAPTMLEVAGIKIPNKMDGRSLFTPTRDRTNSHEELYAETYLPAHNAFAELARLPSGKTVKVGVRRYGLLRPPWKYVVTEPRPLFDGGSAKPPMELERRFARSALYNLLLDWGEQRDLKTWAVKTSTKLSSRLHHYRADGFQRTEVVPTNQHRDKLRSLGYLE